MTASPDRTPSFEDQLARLETIADRLEADDVPLDEALALFEEGVQRLRAAGGTLERAEQEIARLVEDPDGTFSLAAPRA